MCYYSNDLGKIGKVIRDHFEVVTMEDKQEALQARPARILFA
ncbi:hypothetical protein FTUN_6312 [Frigoriglobus tundricola]|uniref:Uncharacterized protein n=1 Tax=Frigoriglobus tundricola TaxID=2774151 RepID=A0A6M5YX75_9BACT|nr:hypothetical protein FTUN_6312 [Frigoriglobus tundricola]